MIESLSVCHLASVTDKFLCSWCGETIMKPEAILNGPADIAYDIELTLRRWKENDCSTEDMMNRLRAENKREYYKIVKAIRPMLQQGNPMYRFNIETSTWVTYANSLKYKAHQYR